MLSGMDASELVRAVVAGDEARLTKAPGVGKKTAQRIILELKDKLVKQGLASAPALSARAGSSSSSTLADLESALANLGYKPAQIERAKSAVGALVDEGAPFDRLLLHALQSV
jgi:Holliday junction DNA helicase RuvA